MSDVAIGTLRVRQSELTADWSPPRAYDLIIAAVSWEDRSLTALRILAPHRSDISLLYFKSKTDAVEEAKQENLKAARSLFAEVTVVELSTSTEVEANFARLETWVRDAYVKKRSPLKVLIDVSSLPKTYLLFLVGMGFTRDYFACLDCMYVGGAYDLASEDRVVEDRSTGARALISEGAWRSDLIPYLTANSFLPGARDLVVTIGGEIGLSVPFIERVEPTRLSLIFIKETAPDPGREMLETERAALESLMAEPNAVRTDFGLGDVVSLATHTVEFCRAASGNGISGMAIGSKPHAIALSIAALAEPNLEIICRTPAAYKSLNVRPSGLMYFYEIEDRFEPCSYIDA